MSKTLEELLAGGALSNSDLVMVNQGGQSKRVTLATLKTFVGAGSGTGTGAGLANVNSYLNEGDTNYDGAISRCLAANNTVHFPAKPTLADSNNYYHTTVTVTLQQGQSMTGDGPGVSKLVCDTANVPVVTLGNNIYWYRIANLTIGHSVTATVGGDGIYQGQGATAWVDNCVVENVLLVANYNGANLGKAFSGHWRTVIALGNVNDGFLMTTNGASTVGGSPRAGPLQTVFTDCQAAANGHDGFSYKTTGTAAAGSSLGTLINCVTYANQHHGVSAIGLPGHKLNSVRIEGGFFGEDLGQGIYLDTYGGDHSICPQFIELSGQYNIYLTGNNTTTYVRVSQCGGAWYDGLLNLGATETIIDGGHWVNNGRAGGSGLLWAGIRIDGGSATITGIRARDTGSGIQDYGISVNGDNVLISACRLDGNAVSPIAWATTPTNSLVSGCFPASANTGGSGTTITGNLSVTGNITATGNISTASGDVTGKRLGAGAIPGGASTTLSAVYAPYVNAVNAVTLTSPSGQFDASAGGSLVVRDAAITRSLGVGASASGSTGRIDSTSLSLSGAITGVSNLSMTGSLNFNGSGSITGLTTCSMNSTLNLNSAGNISGIVNMGIVGDVTMTQGNLYLNGTGAGHGGLSCQSAYMSGALGVGTAPSSTVGRVDATSVYRAGSPL